MRILLVADLHYNLRQFDWVMAHAAEHDAVVIAGDHLNIVSPVALEAQIVAVRTTLARMAERARLFVCSGNHDLNTCNDAGEKTADWLDVLRNAGVAVDGDSVREEDTLFTPLPWWDGPVSRRAVESLLERTSGGMREGRWVWVYHSPPEGPLSWTGSRHFGDPVICGWIERWRPALVLCGHIHQAPFTAGGSWVDRLGSTWLFNPGAQTGAVPSRVEIDLDRATARWTSLAGVEDRCLVVTADGQ